MKIEIANKLFAFFLLVSMVPVAIVGYVIYRRATNAIRDLNYDKLSALAQARAHRIDLFFEGGSSEEVPEAGAPGAYAWDWNARRLRTPKSDQGE